MFEEYLTMSLLGECRDINGLAVKHGLVYVAGPGECHQCICESGVPKRCEDVMCHQPENCTTFRKGARCCDFVCLDDIPSGKPNLDNDFGLRLVASVITAVLSFSLLFFLIHRLRQRKIRSGRQNRQLSEDERSLGSIGYITGSLGYLPGPMERYEEPTAHFPHYPLWKPPGNYFPRGEAPPPYEEAVAATRAEALAAAMATGNLHTTPANFSQEALLGVSYNTYAVGNFIGGGTHRTIPMNLATSASFTLQPERFDSASVNGGASCTSVAAGTVSVTATVTAPPLNRSDIINAEITHPMHVVDSSLCAASQRRSEGCLRLDVPQRSESNQRPPAVGHYPEIHRNGSSHHPDIVSKNQRRNEESPVRSDSNRIYSSHRSDALSHRLDHASHEINQRDDMWHQNSTDSVCVQRGEERRLSTIPPSDHSFSLPVIHHSHGIHHHPQSFNLLHHQAPTVHPIGLQHQVNNQVSASRQSPLSLMDVPALHCDKDISAGTSKMKAPQFSSILKPGTGVCEDVRSLNAASGAEPHDQCSHTAPHRRTKLANVISSGVSSLTRRGLTPVPAPTVPAGAQDNNASPSHVSAPRCSCLRSENAHCNCHSSNTSLEVGQVALPQNSDLSLNQSGLDDNDDYRSECENCKSTHSSNYYLDAEDPEPEITMTLHRKPTESGEENGNSYYRTSLTLPTRHRVVPLHGTGGRDSWFSSMPESSTDESEED